MQNTIDWLLLARSTGIKNETLRFAIDQYGYNPLLLKEKIIEHSKNAGCFEKIKFADLNIIQKELENTTKYGANIISIFDENYPHLLRKVYNAPLVISAKGNLKTLNQKSIGIVGSRQPLFHSQEIAMEIALELTKNNFAIISGLAIGIDSSAHIGALKYGSTIAVLGSGIDIVYPGENRRLYEEICEKGAVISQYPFSTPPRPGNFPIRNQIIAGLSLAVVVVEAYKKSDTGRSGSLITAEFAYNIQRDVYTIPGFPTKDGRFSGNNYLIKSKIATLIENAEDILKNIANINIVKERIEEISTVYIDKNQNIDELNKCKFKILSCLGSIPMSINEIFISTQLQISTIRVALIELELAGIILRGYDGKVIKT